MSRLVLIPQAILQKKNSKISQSTKISHDRDICRWTSTNDTTQKVTSL